jgi:hypothetical protein
MPHLAQLNIARMLYPADDERMAGFMNQLDVINALAEAAPGFVWRFISSNNSAVSERPFDDDMLIVNLSVWEDIESLHAYTYRSDHARLFKDRRLWFEFPKEAHFLMWWVPDGVVPTVEQAKARLNHIRTHGPTAHAFTFKERFAPPDPLGR